MKLNKKQLESKVKHHEKRVVFYNKKIEDLDRPAIIGFKRY